MSRTISRLRDARLNYFTDGDNVFDQALDEIASLTAELAAANRRVEELERGEVRWMNKFPNGELGDSIFKSRFGAENDPNAYIPSNPVRVRVTEIPEGVKDES